MCRINSGQRSRIAEFLEFENMKMNNLIQPDLFTDPDMPTSSQNFGNTYVGGSLHVGKKILDACCGSKMFWFDKQNNDVLFIDKRRETVTAKDSSNKKGIRVIDVNPDVVADFTEMPFEDESFYMVVFDPPHLKTLGETSWMAKKYGRLPHNWKEIISKGFDECMRVLKPNGTLIFKWNESEIMANEVLNIIPYKPLFGHTTGRQSKTIWMAFMKLNAAQQ